MLLPNRETQVPREYQAKVSVNYRYLQRPVPVVAYIQRHSKNSLFQVLVPEIDLFIALFAETGMQAYTRREKSSYI